MPLAPVSRSSGRAGELRCGAVVCVHTRVRAELRVCVCVHTCVRARLGACVHTAAPGALQLTPGFFPTEDGEVRNLLNPKELFPFSHPGIGAAAVPPALSPLYLDAILT